MEKRFRIIDPAGIHARPASNIVAFANSLDIEMILKSNGNTKSAKSIIGLMSLGLKFNDEFFVSMSCADEGEEMLALVELFTKQSIAEEVID